MDHLPLGELRADALIGREVRERGRAEAISDLQRGCFIGLDA